MAVTHEHALRDEVYARLRGIVAEMVTGGDITSAAALERLVVEMRLAVDHLAGIPFSTWVAGPPE